MIKVITSILSLLWVLLVGTPTDKARLNKKPTHEDRMKNLNCWIEMNFHIICVTAIAILLIIFVIVCFMTVGVSAVESGKYYYHLEDII